MDRFSEKSATRMPSEIEYQESVDYCNRLLKDYTDTLLDMVWDLTDPEYMEISRKEVQDLHQEVYAVLCNEICVIDGYVTIIRCPQTGQIMGLD